MSKTKGLGKFVAFAAIAGAAAAGISYLSKYRSFNKELDEDFHDFEDDEAIPDSTMNRNYVSLSADKDELLVAAGDMLHAAKDVAGATKNVVKDAAAIVKDTAKDAVSAVADTAASVKNTSVAEDSDDDISAQIFGEEFAQEDETSPKVPNETGATVPASSDTPTTDAEPENSATVDEDPDA